MPIRFVRDTRYKNTCSKCKKDIPQHSEALWSPEDGLNFHLQCNPELDNANPPKRSFKDRVNCQSDAMSSGNQNDALAKREANLSQSNAKADILKDLPLEISQKDIEIMYSEAIEIVRNKCQSANVPMSFSDIGKVFDALVQVQVQSFEVKKLIFIYKSKLEDRERAKANLGR